MKATRRAAAAILSAILAACGSDGPTVPAGTTMSLDGGDGQTIAIGATLSSPLTVLVADAVGAPLRSLSVTWTVASGGGTVTASGPTGSDGIASATYRSGTTSGPKSISASLEGASGSPVTYRLTVLPGAAKRLTKASGDLQAGGPGAPLALPLKVQVVDTFGNGVTGTAVAWAVTSGGGSVSPSTSVSDSTGLAATVYTASSTIGAATVTAAAATLLGSPITFSVTTTIGATLVGEIPVPANYGQHDQFIRGGLAFLSSWDTGLQIYDVGGGTLGGSPSDPRFVSRIVTSGGEVHNAWWYWAPTGEKRYVFVGQEGPGSLGSSSSGDIHVVDITTIGSPTEVAHYHMAGAGTHNFWVDEINQVLYAAFYNGGIVALDVSGVLTGDLATREIARIRPGGTGTYTWGVMLYGGSLYAIDVLSGFWQLKLVGSAFQVLGGGNNVPDRYGSDMWVAGGYGYTGTLGSRVGNIGNVVKTWRLNATGAPVLADSIVTPDVSYISDVEVSPDGRMLMFSTQFGQAAGIYFYSLVGNPGHPAFISRYLVTANGQNGIHTATFAQLGGRLYVFAAKYPNSNGGTDPKAPSMIVLDVTAIAP
jgi:hypothetical protein